MIGNLDDVEYPRRCGLRVSGVDQRREIRASYFDGLSLAIELDSRNF